jgi:hypothetical protein
MTVLFLFELSRVGYNLLVTSLGWLKGSGFLIGVMWVVVVVVVVVAAAEVVVAEVMRVEMCVSAWRGVPTPGQEVRCASLEVNNATDKHADDECVCVWWHRGSESVRNKAHEVGGGHYADYSAAVQGRQLTGGSAHRLGRQRLYHSPI